MPVLGKRVQYARRFQVFSGLQLLFVINIDQTKWMKWLSNILYTVRQCMCITTYFSLFFGCFWWPKSLCIFTYKFQFADLMKMHFLVSSFLSAICQITSWRVYQTDFLTAFPSWHICKWVSYLTKEIIGQKQMIILKIFF